MNVNTSSLLGKRYGLPVLLGAVAFAAEMSRGYILDRIRNRSMIIVPAEPEQIVSDNIYDETEALELLDVALDQYIASFEEVEEDEEIDLTPSRVNIFLDADSGWNYEYEIQHRTPDVPYVIHADEFINDEMGYKQKTVTYYETDDIMADEADVPIYNWPTLMGELKWGHGSKDKNVVYIRNEKEHKEWEVLLHSGSYEIEVQGLRIDRGELMHSQHRVPKFRND
jgi:hypothetical protein